MSEPNTFELLDARDSKRDREFGNLRWMDGHQQGLKDAEAALSRAESAEARLGAVEAVLRKTDWSCDHGHDWTGAAAHATRLRAALANPPAVRCDTCSDSGRIPWMIEGDPNCYQERDDDDTIACPDCTPVEHERCGGSNCPGASCRFP